MVCFAVQDDFSGIRRIRAEDSAQQFGSSGTENTGDSQNFSSVQFEGDVLIPAFPGQVPDFHDNLFSGNNILRTFAYFGLAEHHGDETGIVNVLDVFFADIFCIPQYRYGIRNLVDFG